MQVLLWHLQAPCRAGDQRWWYPPDWAPDPKPWYERGRSVCRLCPVWEECQRAGENEKFGMWAGLTPRERFGKRAFPCGTWLRYRQGCRCRKCARAHATACTQAA